MRARLAVALVVAALILLPRSLAAQDDFDRWWKPELAAPGNHRVVFENDEVRVLEVTVPPGTRAIRVEIKKAR